MTAKSYRVQIRLVFRVLLFLQKVIFSKVKISIFLRFFKKKITFCGNTETRKTHRIRTRLSEAVIFRYFLSILLKYLMLSWRYCRFLKFANLPERYIYIHTKVNDPYSVTTHIRAQQFS